MNEDRLERDAERVRKEYARRAADPVLAHYERRVQPAMEQAAAERRRLTLHMLAPLGPLAQLKVLDVGCGRGDDLAWLAGLGIPTASLAGVDLHEPAVATARTRVLGASVQTGNGAALPFPDNHFDAALQTVVLSSVVDPVVRQAVATELLRVVRPGGVIVSYDMIRSARHNPHLRGIDRDELQRLFRGQEQDVRRLTLGMPIASRLPKPLRAIANSIPVLRTHLLAGVTVDG
jgi:ubiquinone/menaquinone biosynthesis C-methylase UbiE